MTAAHSEGNQTVTVVSHAGPRRTLPFFVMVHVARQAAAYLPNNFLPNRMPSLPYGCRPLPRQGLDRAI